MNKALVPIVAVIAVVLFGVSVYASPYWTLHRLKLSGERRAGGTTSHHVDHRTDLVLGYRSWSVATLCGRGHEGGNCLVLRRRGLWTWKLAAIEMPQLAPAAN